MANLREEHTGKQLSLRPESIIGRSSHCAIRLESPRVSSVHARIRWLPGGWELKDLGSTNGTYLNGRRIMPASANPLRAGDRIAFGNLSDSWRLLDEDAPGLVLTAEDGASRSSEDLLAIPSAEDPAATVYRDADGEWRLEVPGEPLRRIEAGVAFVVAGQRWVPSLPDAALATHAANAADVRQAKLRFFVSSDEESVKVEIHNGLDWIDLGIRAQHYLLLTLARLRLKEQEAGDPESNCGWCYQDELAHSLGVSPLHVNVDVFRLRKRLSSHFGNAAALIERRPGTRQLRLGVRDSVIERA